MERDSKGEGTVVSQARPPTARRLRRREDGILAFSAHPITNGFAEGMNNTIKVIKRRARSFQE